MFMLPRMSGPNNMVFTPFPQAFRLWNIYLNIGKEKFVSWVALQRLFDFLGSSVSVSQKRRPHQQDTQNGSWAWELAVAVAVAFHFLGFLPPSSSDQESLLPPSQHPATTVEGLEKISLSCATTINAAWIPMLPRLLKHQDASVIIGKFRKFQHFFCFPPVKDPGDNLLLSN